MTQDKKNNASNAGNDERLYELQALFDLSKTLNSSLKLRSILDTLLLTPMGRLLIGKGLIMLRGKDNGFVIETVKGLAKSFVEKTIRIDDLPERPAYLKELSPAAWQAFLLEIGIELVIPIQHGYKSLGVIGFGKKVVGVDYTDVELDYLHSLSNIAATSIQNSIIFEELNAVNKQLDKKVQELNTLFEIGQELNSSLESEKVVNLLGYSIMGELMVNRCLVFLLEVDNSMKLAMNKGFGEAALAAILNCSDLKSKIGQMKEPMEVEACPDKELSHELRAAGVCAVVPMTLKEETRGLIAIGDKIAKTKFTKSELDFLRTLGNLSMISIENARLFEETLEKQRLEKELLIARDIQRQLLPDVCPEIPGYDLAARNISSMEIGGDYFDCIRLDSQHYAFCVADVSGKGVPASLLMSNLQAGFHALVNTGLELTQVAGRINDLIFGNTSYDKFITCFFAILNPHTGDLLSVNAGHNPPYIYHKDGTFDTLMEGGLILGMMKDIVYDSQTVKLQSGDCLVMFTDGISEAMNHDGEEFLERRVEESIKNHYSQPALQLLESILADVRAFAGRQPQSDDMTLMIIKVD